MSEDTPRRRPTTGGLSIPNSPRATYSGHENKVQPDGTYTLPRARPKRARRLSSGSPPPTESNNNSDEAPKAPPPEIVMSRLPLTPRSFNTPALSKLNAPTLPTSLPPIITSPPPPKSPPPVSRQFVNPEVPGYVGFANLPNQVHRKSVKKGFEFTLMVVGESGLGKSTLVNSLFDRDLYPDRHIPSAADKLHRTVKINASTKDIEERGVKLRLTVVDTPGFADALNNADSFKPIIQYIDDQFERYYQDESGLNRRNIVDTRVHCCFYFINPAGHGLRPLDIAFMKAVHHKVNVVPVIAKADTLTRGEVNRLKAKILDEVKRLKIMTYQMPDGDDDEDDDYKEQCRQLKAAVPFAVVGSSQEIEVRGRRMRGRLYPWGVVEVENPDHCDFIKIRAMLITHLQDLQEVTHEVHYESFRKTRLGRPVEDEQLSVRQRELEEKEMELRRMQEMINKMQSEMTRGSAANITAGLPPSNGVSSRS